MQGYGYDEEKGRWFDSYNLINHATGEQAYYVYHYPEDYRAAPSWVDKDDKQKPYEPLENPAYWITFLPRELCVERV